MPEQEDASLEDPEVTPKADSDDTSRRPLEGEPDAQASSQPDQTAQPDVHQDTDPQGTDQTEAHPAPQESGAARAAMHTGQERHVLHAPQPNTAQKSSGADAALPARWPAWFRPETDGADHTNPERIEGSDVRASFGGTEATIDQIAGSAGAAPLQRVAGCGCFCCGDDSFGYGASGTGQSGTSTGPDEGAAGGGPVTVHAASGDAGIDGILHNDHWTGPVYYAFPDAAGDYQAGYTLDRNGNTISAQNEGFSQLSAAQQLAVHFALNDFTGYTNSQPAAAVGFSAEGFTNLTIDFTTSDSTATMRYANTSDNSFGYGFFPSTSDYGGDAWMGTSIQ
ncbi:hypothetical protein AB9K41_19450, partial [Cribrihabitans sp. XS_ASV171]